MNNQTHQSIANDIKELLKTMENPAGLTTINFILKVNYYYKLSNLDKEQDKNQTIESFSVDSVTDAIEIMYIVEDEKITKLELKNNLISSKLIDYDKSLHLLVKLKE